MPLISWKLSIQNIAYLVINIYISFITIFHYYLYADYHPYYRVINIFHFRCKVNKFISFSANNLLKSWLKRL